MNLLEDGRYVHTFHQSWLGHYLECPESARQVMLRTYPREETDATARGSAVHASIEAVLTRLADPSDAVQVGVDTFYTLLAQPQFRWVKIKTEKTALAHIQGGFSSWYNYAYPKLGATTWVEHRFDFTFHEDEHRVIRLAGTVDYAEAAGLSDWKLTSNTDKYGRDGWKQKRWAIQPTVYAAAAYEERLFDHTETVPFMFVALSPQGRQPQLCSADRTWDHVQWLREQVVSISLQIEADLSQWPVRDQHALCSPDWCQHWGDCKGKHLPNPKAKDRE